MSLSSLHRIQSQSASLGTQAPCNRQNMRCDSCNAATFSNLHLAQLEGSQEGFHLSTECQSCDFV